MTIRSSGVAPASVAGRSIVSAKIGSGGHLFVTYSDGSIMDAGAMPGVDITVGDGPPSVAGDPGDLYLDALSGDLYRMEN